MPSGPEIFFLSLFCSAILEGVHTALEVVAIYVLWQRRRTRKGQGERANSIALCLSFLSWSICTTTLFIAFRTLIAAFENPLRADLVTLKYHTVGLARLCLGFFNIAIADSILVWRAWVVCRFPSRLAIIPGAVIVTALALELRGVLTIEKTDSLSKEFARSADGKYPWLLAGAILSLAVNISATGLIAGKLWLHERRMGSVLGRSSQLSRIALIVVQSGAVYVATWIFFIVCWALRLPIQLIALDINVQLAGIVPTVLVVLVALGVGKPAPQLTIPSASRSLNFVKSSAIPTTIEYETSTNSSRPESRLSRPDYTSVGRTVSFVKSPVAPSSSTECEAVVAAPILPSISKPDIPR